jgi:subtilisin family serine protease
MSKLFSNKRSLVLFLSGLIFVCLLVLLGFKYKNNFSSKADTAAVSTSVSKTEFVNNQILVKFKPDALAKMQDKNPATRTADLPTIAASNTGIDSLNKINTQLKATKVTKAVKSTTGTRGMSSNVDIDRWYVINYDLPTKNIKGDIRKTSFAGSADKKLTYANLIKSYQAVSGIEAVEPNYIRKASMSTNDTFLSSQTYIKGIDDLYGLKKIGAPQAWDKTMGGAVTVAVVDSGVDYNHPDMKDSVLRDLNKKIIGYDFVNNDSDPIDDAGHGTFVAGIIAATGNNDLNHALETGVKLVGVGPKLKIMPVKVLDSEGIGYTSVSASGIKYAVDNGAKIVNFSICGPGIQTSIEKDVIKYAYDKGVVIVVSAGNDNLDIVGESVAGDPRVVTVGASDSGDKKAYFSNFGVAMDFVAPGLDILSAKNRPLSCSTTLIKSSPDCTAYYGLNSGTSFAAPHVAAAAALIRALHPDWSIEEVRFALRNTADKTNKVAWDSQIGFGRINLASAVNLSTPPPVAFLDIPKSAILAPNYAISGVVLARSGVSSWKLSSGEGSSPKTWISLATGTKEVNGVLGKLPATIKTDIYTLKLEVTDKTGKISLGYSTVNSSGTLSVIIYDPANTGNAGFATTSPGKIVPISALAYYTNSDSTLTSKINMSIYADGVLACSTIPIGSALGDCNWTVPALPKPGRGKLPYKSYTYNLQVKATDLLGNVAWSDKMPITSSLGRTR